MSLSRRIADSLQRAATLDVVHVAMAVGAAGAAALTISAGLAVARSGPAETAARAERIAAATRGDFSQSGLLRLQAGLDPAALTVVRALGDEAPDLAPGWRPGDEPRELDFQPVDSGEAQRINRTIPFARDPVAPAAPFYLRARSPAERERAVRCLANAVYYEAALEPEEGQRAVAQVVLNRVRDVNFPKSVCGVVYEGWERTTGCQFSFTCDGALVRSPIPVLWSRARKVAEAALAGHVQKDVGSATHYHADYVAPYWAPGLVKLSKIGAHIFYRWPGAAGLPQAHTAAYAGGELRLSEAVLNGRARPAPTPVVASREEEALGVRTVTVKDPVTGEARTRMQATFTPETWGRRKATPEDIAKINALLEARYPSKPAEGAKPADPAPLASAEAKATPAAG